MSGMATVCPRGPVGGGCLSVFGCSLSSAL